VPIWYPGRLWLDRSTREELRDRRKLRRPQQLPIARTHQPGEPPQGGRGMSSIRRQAPRHLIISSPAVAGGAGTRGPHSRKAALQDVRRTMRAEAGHVVGPVMRAPCHGTRTRPRLAKGIVVVRSLHQQSAIDTTTPAVRTAEQAPSVPRSGAESLSLVSPP